MAMIDIPGGRQTFDFDCGAKALQLVMAYYGVDVREDELIKELEVDRYGVPIKNMISAAVKRGFQVLAKSGFSLEAVKQYVDENHPVIVLVQAWAERYMTIDDWREDNDDGHYTIVVGYHGYAIVFEDPASFRKTWMTEEEFVARWHDIDPRTQEKLDQFAMVLLGKQPAKKVIEHMD
jgi:predicted double-glycine peptidase